MRRVLQEDSTGCGLACVAMVARVSYEEVRAWAVCELGFSAEGPFNTDVVDLRFMLAEYGYRLSRRTVFTAYGPISPLGILGLERCGSGEEDHWAVLVKCGLDMYVLDPSPSIKAERRRDWWKLRPVSYMNVTKL